MNGSTTTWPPANAVRYRWLVPAVLILGAATVAAAVAGDGSIFMAAAPVVLVVLLSTLWFVPLRIPMLTLTFLALGLDVTGNGPWDSPVAWLGKLLFHNLNKIVPVSALPISVMVLLLAYFLVIHAHRLLSASRADAARIQAASPMLWGLACSLLTVAVWVALGYKRGGDVQMAKNQVQSFILVLGVAYLLMMSLRGTKDYRVLGGLILAAACIKSVMAMYVVYTVKPEPAFFAITHGESILFASATILLIARYAEQPVRRNAALCVALLPLLILGMIANNRRIVWAEVLAAVLLLFVLSRRTRLKQFVSRALLASLPLSLIYLSVGWDSKASFFAPVATFRSMTDADVDRSTLFRDIEDFNLIRAIRENQLLGSGFGKPFPEIVPQDDISFFKEYHFLPHNSVLGLWAFSGMLGFSGLSAALMIGALLAARSHIHARSPDERVAAFMALAVLLIYEIQCWGDIGFSEGMAVFLVGPALAVAGQLAQVTGAWRVRTAPSGHMVSL